MVVGNYNLWLNVVCCGCGDVVGYGCGGLWLVIIIRVLMRLVVVVVMWSVMVVVDYGW